MTAPMVCRECGNQEATDGLYVCSDCLNKPTVTCQFHLDDGETCRMGLYIEEHALQDGEWVHPDYVTQKGRWGFRGDKVPA